MINKNIQIWRGFETPPTNYHIWFKNGILSMFNGEAWVEITKSADYLSGIESDITNIYDIVIPSIKSDIAKLESGLLTEGSVTVDKLGNDVKDMIANSGIPIVDSSDALSADAVVGSFASIVVEGKTQLWVKNDTGWQEYGKESDPEEITNITDIL